MARKTGKVRYDNKGRKLPEGIEQRKNGRYQIRITLDGKQHVDYDWNYAEAKKKLAILRGKLAVGAVSDLTLYTLNEWYDKWLSTYKKSVLKQRTYNNYERYWNRYIRDSRLGKMRLDKVKQIDIVKVYRNLTEREERPLAHSTVVYLNSMINSALEQAVQNGLISNNPAVGAMKHINGREEKKRYALDEKEEEVFLRFVSESRYQVHQPMFTILLRTGMRAGEMKALTWKDIDFERKCINIDKSMNYDNLEGESGKSFFITSPKTKSSIRKIPMLPEVEVAFIKQKEWQENFGIRDCCEVKRFNNKKKFIGMCNDFIITTSKGTVPTAESLNRTIRAIIKDYNKQEKERAEVEGREEILLHDFTIHSTRHTFATRSFEKDMNSKCVSEVLGHSSEVTSRKIYTHPKKDILRREMERAWA